MEARSVNDPTFKAPGQSMFILKVRIIPLGLQSTVSIQSLTRTYCSHAWNTVKLSEDLFDMASSMVQHIRESKVVRESAATVESLFPSIESMKTPSSTRKDAMDANDAVELHISLTRPLYLQQIQLDRFAAELKETLEGRKKVTISFSGLQCFSNDDCSRSFVSFRVGAGHAEVRT